MACVFLRISAALVLAAGLSACGTTASTVPKLPDAPTKAAETKNPHIPPKPVGYPKTPRTQAKKSPAQPQRVAARPRNPLKNDVWNVPTLRPQRQFKNNRRATSFARPIRLPEHPFTNNDLHRNFLSIALRAEAADDTDGAGEIAIAKWETPLRYTLHSGKADDFAQVAGVTARLRLLTGLDIQRAKRGEPSNMELWFVSPLERSGVVAQMADEKAIGPQVARLILRWRDTEAEKCLGLMATDPRRSSILNSVILIKDELPKRIRDACIVEEIVQSLGLMNDDRRAKPSIFNDDQQYLDLTTHDEYLLRILYDRRIRPGMTRRQIEPILRGIIHGLRAGKTV